MALGSLRSLADALLFTDPRFPWVGPTEGEKEVAMVMIEMSEIHVPDRLDPDNPDDDPMFHRYGFCRGCFEQWPCQAVQSQEMEGVTWVGRAASRVHSHAVGPIDPIVRAMGQASADDDTVRRDPAGRVLSDPRAPCNVEIPPHRDTDEGNDL